MHKPGRIWRRMKRVALAIFLFISCFIIYMACVCLVDPPNISDQRSLHLERREESPGFYTIQNNWFRKSNSGLYELYIEGAPFERGVIAGKLAKELVVRQEDYFCDQINKIIPSSVYRHFLKYFIGWFNRDLHRNITREYQEEIYGISKSADEKYLYIGSNYQRLLNYHAAHDIGHALQNMMLVGCTSFGTWGNKSKDQSLIIGRNFDFYVGDKFGEDKIVEFVNPSTGNKFMIVTWGGFIGAVSGMNEKGLTVTINSAKSDFPTGSATPVSIVAREILQYAKNIKEAQKIIAQRKMFVSESFLIGSAADHKAVILEKTPNELAIYDPGKNQILCTNHFQSTQLNSSVSNIKQMNESATNYRYQRLLELLNAQPVNTVTNTISILRNRKGIQNVSIGNGNEKAINQLIAHHSIVFEPEKLLFWISTDPWQLGPFISYDLKKVFAMHGKHENSEIYIDSLTINADPFINTSEYQNFLKFRIYKQQIIEGNSLNPDSIITSNPDYYLTWTLTGDVLFNQHQYEKAAIYYQTALRKIIATKKEEQYLRDQLKICEEKNKKYHDSRNWN